MTDGELLEQLEEQKSIMIAVATGGPGIKTVNDQYTARRAEIRAALNDRGLRDPNPHGDLWAWYGRWSNGSLPSYQSRRQYISEMHEPLVDVIQRGPGRTSMFEEPTGWAKVDRTLAEIRRRLAEAENEEQFQGVGLLCREALISLAQAVYDAARHPTLDGVAASDTDAKRMLEAYVAVELAGGANEELRAHAKASVKLALALQHQRTANFRAAALCSEATTSACNMIAIISGQRDRA